MIEAQNLSLIPEVRHGFFTRKGGVSTGIYRSLNCGAGSRDELAAVKRNHTHVATALGLVPEQLVTLHQHHSPDIVTVTEPWAIADRPRADGMVTDRPGIALGVLTADCAPVLFADHEGGIIGAAHAGWRGAKAGVCGAVLEAMEALGAKRARISAAIGPCIQLQNYEVGEDFRDDFIAEAPETARFFTQAPGEKPHFDLSAYTLWRLERDGVASALRIERCTYEEPENFFSYRRACHAGETDYGRMISAITLGPDDFLKG